MLSAGMMAPDFELPNQHGDMVRLSGFRGRRNVVIAFHPLAFTPVCAAQMQEYERERATLDGQHAHVLGISIDAGPAKKAWADMLGGISFDLLSDFHPHGKVAALYGVMRDDGIACGATECSSCRLQMEQGAPKPTLHPLKLLAWSYAGRRPALQRSTSRLLTT